MNELQTNMETLTDNNVDQQRKIWKVKNRYHKKEKPSIPIAKKNLSNTIVTNPHELKRVYVKHFQHRMRLRQGQFIQGLNL